MIRYNPPFASNYESEVILSYPYLFNNKMLYSIIIILKNKN